MSANATTRDLLVRIRQLADTRDWRYFEFYAGHVQTVGGPIPAGEQIRLHNRAAAAADECGAEHAEDVKRTYLTMILPLFEGRDDLDARTALTYTHAALRRCPTA
jgi:hypothetical protein